MVSVSNDLEGMQAEHIDLQFPDEINSGNFGVQGVSFLFLFLFSSGPSSFVKQRKQLGTCSFFHSPFNDPQLTIY